MKNIQVFENCKSCENHHHRYAKCKECDGEKYYGELYQADPDCRHEMISAGGGGVRCKKCGGWFCY